MKLKLKTTPTLKQKIKLKPVKPIVLIEAVEGFVPNRIEYTGIYERDDKEIYLLYPKNIKSIAENILINKEDQFPEQYFFKSELLKEDGKYSIKEKEKFYKTLDPRKYEHLNIKNGTFISFSEDFFKRLEKAYFMVSDYTIHNFSYGRYGPKFPDHVTEFEKIFEIANKLGINIEEKIFLVGCKHRKSEHYSDDFNSIAKGRKINFLEAYCDNNRSYAPDFMKELTNQEMFY